MYNKTSFINETDYAEVSGTRWIMRDLPNYAEGHHMRKIMRAHNRIIQRSLVNRPTDRPKFSVSDLSSASHCMAVRIGSALAMCSYT